MTRVPVADDDLGVRSALRSVLVDAGYEVLEATTGGEVLELLAAAADQAASPPDVVILDVCMPELSGLGVLKALRTFARTPPMLVVTAFRDRSVDVLAYGLGARRILHKPLDLDELLTAVAACALSGAPP